MKEFQNTFISKADKTIKIIILKNFEITEAYLSKCQENIFRKWKKFKYYNDHYWKTTKLNINIAE